VLNVVDAVCRKQALYAEFHYAECRYTQCQYTQRQYAKCRGTKEIRENISCSFCSMIVRTDVNVLNLYNGRKLRIFVIS
jgi:hypothetical protein